MSVARTHQPRFRFDPARLRATRKAQGLSHEAPAVRVRCSVLAIASRELGNHEPRADKFAGIVDARGVRLDDLIVPVDEAVTP